MSEEISKRSYNFPKNLLTAWEEFHKPSTKDYSASAAAAFLLYMVIEPNLREILRKLAYTTDMKKARIKARKDLRQTIIDAYWAGFVGNLSDEDRAILLEDAIQSEKKLSGKKSNS